MNFSVKSRSISRTFWVALSVLCVVGTPAIALSQSVARPMLKSGSRGAEVTELQAVLKLLGFFGDSVDGIFGDSTAIAVTRFQAAAGLDQDGIVGNATWNRLFPPTDGRTAMTTTPMTTTPMTTPTAPPRQTRPVQSEPPASSGFPILRRGMRGDAVTGLQQRLQAIGVYDGDVDGIFGEQTEAAVKAAQEKFQLDADGIVGPATWSAILR